PTRAYIDDLPNATVPGAPRPDTRTGAVVAAPRASALSEWIVRETAGDFTIHLPTDDGAEEDPGPSDTGGSAPVRGTLAASGAGDLTVVAGPSGSTFEFQASSGCADFPEAEVNIDGPLRSAGNPAEGTQGFIDAHLHMMAFEFIGGRSRCGRPWHPYGITRALVDCPDHEPGGAGAMLETVLSGVATHDTKGWPDFPYWPKYNSLTHEQVYYRWMERAWRGGLGMFTNLLVDNNALCEAWYYKKRSCNEMDGVRLQAQRLRELERYVDAQWGGPGKGWLRIVTDPFQARRVINEGRLAVVMGIEVSVLFDCGIVAGVPQCDEDDIDQRLAEVHDLGVRQMEFVNKFDNALSGVTGDNGTTGIVVNTGNFADTGQWWQMETCPGDRHAHKHDRRQTNLGDDGRSKPLTGRDAIFGGVLQVAGTTGVAPVYPEGPHCNVRGLTDLGRHLLDRMAERGMLFDPDHMSTRGRDEALDHLQARGYGGVVSSHSWSDDTVYERILEMGGVVTPYAGGSTGFLDKWRQTRAWADGRYLFGIGYGADTNGFGSQGGPRSPAPGKGVSYPFTAFGGVEVAKQRSGNQVYDINTDGVDHYGLYPDWIEDIRVQAGADADQFVEDMLLGPEAFLQTWERSLGIENNACLDPRVTPATPAQASAIAVGTRYEDVLAVLGQPGSRDGATFGYCLSEGSADVAFAADGRVASVSTSP
ncbi:MAG TPA: hypothetical protein VNT32_01210, partial [Thermoleophilaceae bacterium]|nr:hypothetical protein [Thermoleophilaceae bacterium]